MMMMMTRRMCWDLKRNSRRKSSSWDTKLTFFSFSSSVHTISLTTLKTTIMRKGRCLSPPTENCRNEWPLRIDPKDPGWTNPVSIIVQGNKLIPLNPPKAFYVTIIIASTLYTFPKRKGSEKKRPETFFKWKIPTVFSEPYHTTLSNVCETC